VAIGLVAIGRRVRILAVVAVLGAVVVGCARPGGPGGSMTFDTAFPADPDRRFLELPVSLIDQTQSVVAVHAAAVADPVLTPRNVPGDPRSIQLAWTGGACESRVRVFVRRPDAAYEISIDADTTIGGMLGCSALGVPRGLIITFDREVDGSTVRAIDVDGAR